MKKIYSILFIAFIFSCNFVMAATGQKLANYLGSGSNPRLQLQLSSNGPNWGTFTIDYQQIGNVPWSSDSSNNWSSWNVYDTNSPPNYYGTITLTSDGNTVEWNSYVAGTEGYYLDGVNFSYNSGTLAYQLTVNSIITPGGGGGGGGTGPFPNTPLATPALYPGTNQPIILQVVGDQIMTDKGDPVLLKGIVRPSLEWSPTGQYLSTQDLSNIANWESNGITARSNVIRLDLYQGYWLNSGPVTEMGSYKQIINAIVYYSIQLGMAVILDLHWTQSGYQSEMANQDSITFWQQVATDYQSFGTVLFELYNEPFNISQAVWLNGNGTYAGYQQLYDAVRGTGAQNICIIAGLDYGYDVSFVSPSFGVVGTNIVYCSHPYNQKGQPGYTGGGGTFQQNYQGIIGNFPLIFTEFGVNDPAYFPNGYNTVYTNILNYANANNVHYTGFAWWVQGGDPQFPCLIQDWEGTPLYGGVNIHNDLVQNPGTLVDGIANAFVTFQARFTPFRTLVRFNGRNFGRGLFCWDFGDATGLCHASPIAEHVYSRSGTYVVKLTTIIRGRPFTTSRTIQVGPTLIPGACVLVCPPRHVQLTRMPSRHGNVVNIISWRAPKTNNLCEKPAYYLVFRDANLTDFVAQVDARDKNGTYRVKDRTKLKAKTAYTVVGVDQNGNRSLPITVRRSSRYVDACGCGLIK